MSAIRDDLTPGGIASPAGPVLQRKDPLLSKKRLRANRGLIRAIQILIVVAVVAFWQIGSSTGFIDPFLWSKPNDVAVRIVQWFKDGTILINLSVTLYEAAMAFASGVIAGIIVGFLLGMADFWAKVLGPFVSVLNAIPRLVFAPLFFLIFGLGPNSKIAIAFSLVFFIVFFNVFRGVREVDKTVLNNAQMLGAVSKWQSIRYVLLPSALAWILSSLQVSVGFAMVGVIVGEYLGSSEGLGYIIARAQGNLDTTGVMAGLVVLSIVAALVTFGIAGVERNLVKWKVDVE